MKVAMYYNNQDVRLKEIPKPEIQEGEILVKVKASGLCGSDIMEWYRLQKAPLVLGHEITGEIVEVGKNVKQYKVGERVFVSHHVPCNTCHYCLSDHHTACETLHKTNYFPGGFAEYIRVPSINVERGVYILPPEISFEVGTFIEPLACVIRGLRLANTQRGHSVLIIGSGVSGLLNLLMTKVLGVSPIISTDINKYRLKKAIEFGADAVIKIEDNLPQKLKENNKGRLADRVIVCAGTLSASQQALMAIDRGGIILFFAVPEPNIDLSLPINSMWRNEITIMTTYGAAPQDLEESIELLRTGQIEVGKLITHRFSLEEAGKGFKLAAEANECLKIIIIPKD